MRVHFTEQFDFAPPEKGGKIVVRYKAGKTYSGVRRLAAEKAVAQGKGEIVDEDDPTPDRPPSLRRRRRAKLDIPEVASDDPAAPDGAAGEPTERGDDAGGTAS